MPLRLTALLLLALSPVGLAQQAAAPPPAPRELAPVLVSGVQPGPRLWKATRGGHTLWILGTLTPAPRRIEWQSREVEHVLDDAGLVVLGARAEVSADVGVFRTLLLVPKMLKARENPDGKTLHDVLPPALHARWLPLKARYLGRDDDVESWRPLFAAQALYEAAIKKSGLDPENQVMPKVRRLARRRDVPTTIAEVKLKFTEPKATLKRFSRTSLEDVACFEKTLDRLETDLADMAARANAWSVGDLETMRRLPYADQGPACLSAFVDNAIAQEKGIDRLPERVRAAWVDAADGALRKHATSLALLPMAEILKPDGYLAALKARGVAIEAPDEAGTEVPVEGNE
jgi:hypothetical protein